MSISEELAEKLLVIANNIVTESEAVEQQTELLQQIRTALVGKTVPGDPDDSGSYDEGYADGYEEGKTDTEVRAIALVNEGLTLSDLAVAEVNSLEEIPEKVDEVYLYGTEEGYESGKKSQYDAFWDAFQENGNRANYLRGFYRWPGTAFNPKYGIYGNILEVFSTSTVTSVKVPIVTGSNSAQEAFYNCQNLVTIESINITGATDVTNMFYVCRALEEIRFEGTIERSLSFPHSSNLSADSVQSIIDHLKDLTGATAQTLTFHATVGGKLTQAQKDAISAKNWTLVY